MKNIFTMALCLSIITLFISCDDKTTVSTDSNFDLVILNGRVMDPETNFDAIRNVGVIDGIISIITEKEIKGKETIDATGHVVTAGFIDGHFHALDGLSVKMAARDGVTTGMDLEIGSTNIAAWYDGKKDVWPLNYGTGVSHEGTRIQIHDPEVDMTQWADAPMLLGNLRAEACKDGVCGWQDTRSDLEHLNQLLAKWDQGFKEGALNFSSTVGYMVKGVSTYEMFKAQELAGKYGRATAAHVRFHGSPINPEASLGSSEILANALVLKAPLTILHDNDYGWWENEEKLKIARANGHNVWSEYYPYDAASTSISSTFLQPNYFLKTFGFKYEETIYDPVADTFLNQEAFVKTVKEHPERLVVIFSPNRKKWLPNWLKIPHMVVASDAIYSGRGYDSFEVPYSEYQGHPRTGGTHGKTFRIAREAGVPLMFTLSQMSYWPALHLGDTGLEAMKVRGRMQTGMVADITIFDPETVADNSTYKIGEQGLPSSGIPYVIVNGTLVVKNSKFQKIFAGQPIRFPVQETGKYEPIIVDEWIQQFATPVLPVDGCGASSEHHHH